MYQLYYKTFLQVFPTGSGTNQASCTTTEDAMLPEYNELSKTDMSCKENSYSKTACLAQGLIKTVVHLYLLRWKKKNDSTGIRTRQLLVRNSRIFCFFFSLQGAEVTKLYKLLLVQLNLLRVQHFCISSHINTSIIRNKACINVQITPVRRYQAIKKI